MLSAKQEAGVDFSGYTDDELRDETEAMQLALSAPQGNPFDGSEARLRQKIDAAKNELDKRDANRS
jgi:hypothetical protein